MRFRRYRSLPVGTGRQALRFFLAVVLLKLSAYVSPQRACKSFVPLPSTCGVADLYKGSEGIENDGLNDVILHCLSVHR